MVALKPGAMLLAFGGTRTWHRLAVAIEDAGFECRDTLVWMYGSGFPKSLNISKELDGLAGAEREVIGSAAEFSRDGAKRKTDGSHLKPHGHQGGHGHGDRWATSVTAPATDEAKLWGGWGTALKPSYEPVILAMKPLDGTFARNALEHGVSGLNIDGCRINPGEFIPGGGIARRATVVVSGLGRHLEFGRKSSPTIRDAGRRMSCSTRRPANCSMNKQVSAEVLGIILRRRRVEMVPHHFSQPRVVCMLTVVVHLGSSTAPRRPRQNGQPEARSRTSTRP